MKLELDYSQWRCGNYESSRPSCRLGHEGIRLFNPLAGEYHNSCCLGLMLQAAGMPRHLMADAGMPHAARLLSDGSIWNTPELVRLRDLLVRPSDPTAAASSDLALSASHINDSSMVISVWERMARLIQLFRANDVELIWRNVPDDIASACSEFYQRCTQESLPEGTFPAS